MDLACELAWEQALLFGRVKNESRKNARASGEAARGRGKESLQRSLSPAPRSRSLARSRETRFSLAQIGELARRLEWIRPGGQNLWGWEGAILTQPL